MRSFVLIFTTFISFYWTTIFAQESPFSFGIIFGRNYSQIDGDYQFGYDKSGFIYGIKGGYRLIDQLDFTTELLFVEKGALPKNELFLSSRQNVDIKYSYAEVPFLLNYHFRKNLKSFFQWNIYSGLSYGRLLESESQVTLKNLIDVQKTKSLSQGNLNKQDIAFIAGVNFSIIKNLAVGVRNSVSLNNVYSNPSPLYDPAGNLLKGTYVYFRNYYLAAQIQYNLIAPKVKPNSKKKNLSRRAK